MIRVLLGTFIVAHGLLTALIWVMLGAGVVALLLMALYFNPWLLPASPSAPGSSTPESKPYRRPSGTKERSS